MQNVIDPNAQEAERQREKQKSSPGYQQWLKNVMEANDKIQKSQLEVKVVQAKIISDREIEKLYIKEDVARLKRGLDPIYQDHYHAGPYETGSSANRYMGTVPGQKPQDLGLTPGQHFAPEESKEAEAFIRSQLQDLLDPTKDITPQNAQQAKMMIDLLKDVETHGGKVEALDKTGPLKPLQTPEQKGFIDIPARNGPKR